MGLTALVMAGGRATRLTSDVEKPLIEINGTTILRRVLNALENSENVERIVVAVSARSVQTTRTLRELGVEIIMTPGVGYEEDMKAAIKQQHLGDVLVVSADLPFLTSTLVDQAIESYRAGGKPALSVMCPLTTLERLGVQPSHVFTIDGRRLVPAGVNILNGARIDEPTLDETMLISDSVELAVNVNTPRDIEIAREIAKNES